MKRGGVRALMNDRCHFRRKNSVLCCSKTLCWHSGIRCAWIFFFFVWLVCFSLASQAHHPSNVSWLCYFRRSSAEQERIYLMNQRGKKMLEVYKFIQNYLARTNRGLCLCHWSHFPLCCPHISVPSTGRNRGGKERRWERQAFNSTTIPRQPSSNHCSSATDCI